MDARPLKSRDGGDLVLIATELDQQVKASCDSVEDEAGRCQLQGTDQCVAAFSVVPAHPPQVAVKTTAGDELSEGELIENVGAGALGHLVEDRRHEPPRQQHPAQPQPGRERLADRAEIGDALWIQASESAEGAAVVPELRVIVVL